MATIVIMKDFFDNIFTYMSIDEVNKWPSVKTAGKKKHFVTEIKEMADTNLSALYRRFRNNDVLAQIPI